MVSEYQLANGIRVVCDRINSANSVAFGVWVGAGSQNENKKNNGIAHMIEHMVFKGTKKRTAAQIADEIADVGGNVDAYTSKEVTAYYAWVLKENLGKTIELLGDMLFHSQFYEGEFEKEKGIVIEEIDMYKDSPEDVVHEMLQKKVWAHHPLGFLISGGHKNVEAFTKEDLKQFMNLHYTADNMILSIAGDFEEKEVLSMLEEAFGCFPKSCVVAEVTTPVFTPAIYTEEKDIEQMHINIAFDSITSAAKERYAFSVLNSILGGGVNSRMFMKIREEMGIAYAIYSYGSSFKKAGLFHIYAGINPSQVENCIEAMGEQIRLFAREGPSEEEIMRAKEQIKTDLIIQCESTKGHMNSNAKELQLFGRIIPLQDTLSLVNQVTQDDIMQAMNHYFNVEKMGVALVGNLNEIKPELMELEWIQRMIR